jgi:multicomponent Na+:H+ antiporter subunit G
MSIREILAMASFVIAVIFTIGAVVGMFRFKDPYSRLQAGSLCGTTSVFSIFIGALLLSPTHAVTARLVIIMIFFLISAPTGSHIVARFLWNIGIFPKRDERERKSR